ncbi:MAG: hypothetical protein HY770_02765 [Chitinivibrionia bacterium]|nr:hypothetical protein [Chitinivibrionia bacterium]
MRTGIIAKLLFAAIVCGALAISFAARARELPAGRLVRVETFAAKDSVLAGERLPVRFTVQYPESLVFLPPAALPAGAYAPVSAGWTGGGPSKGTKRADGTMIIYTLDLQAAHVPPMKLLFATPSGDTMSAWTGDVRVPVRFATADTSRVAPLKSQWEAPRSRLWLVLIAAAAALIAAGLIWWLRRRKARAAVEPARPELPPDVVALRELARIESMKILDGGKYKEYYTLVIDAVRRYVEGRFGIDAMDKTSDELMGALERIPVSIEGFDGMLREADLVKFAKYVPGIVPGKRLMESARRIVVETTPREAETIPAGRTAVEGS